ncbi:DeoR/GlpR transcriptional regulator [Acidipropionibacterium acidipropionici]|uniref:Lactose phosphotransferase system repressor n=2 Tax=Acidipropionibacterium acidipropionici TaxID=1748 RepID=A0A142KHT7_9ACTN|nr:DeoR/GlpR family DNA-binding transcription regulator [Acidipropionibacterium acidipropionici]AFV91112.1 Transcriptional regulator, DeoR family [Acidipropionibacterium acidipropionici ATCC 4875]ALN14816.1 DeoR family transcriptional regulator [Acidipropionibacterium acidipropionici]AMS05675.1 DeoR family transcriptional regulator [Acidipropionibacterium acidipropionici]AOZ47142.1 DeoR family transcriptional regulator [Acidipropionibacterium acidipropionici]APZ09431.1 DeoR family transcriptio
MRRSLRHRTIIRAIGSSRLGVDALADLTGASAVTIRRDLADLEGQGLLKRVHGGAVGVGKRGARMPYAIRASEDLEQKEALGELTASLIEDQQSLVLDNGTTNDAVARSLQDRPLTVLCMSLYSAVILGQSPNTQVITPGGLVSPDSLIATGTASVAAARDMRADVAILGACAASPTHGLTTTTWEDGQIKRAIMACAARRILVATARKLTRTSSFRFAGLEDLDDLVTTDDAPQALIDQFTEAGVVVHLAEGPAQGDTFSS